MKSNSSPIPPNLFWEARTAESLGISRTAIRKLRHEHLAEGADWTMHENAVVLTAAGVGKLAALLHPLPKTLAKAESPAATTGGVVAMPPGPPAKRLFMVTKKPVFRSDAPQRKILVCAEAPEKAVDVPPWDVIRLKNKLGLGVERPIRVRDNANFLPGMVIEAVAIGFGMWQYIGRLPRRPGRW